MYHHINIVNFLDELQDKLQTCKEAETKWNLKAKDLEVKMKDAKGYRDKKLKEAEEEMKVMKKQYEKSRNEWKKREQDYETLNLEISELKKSIETTRQQIDETEENIKKLKVQYEEMSSGVTDLKVRYSNFFVVIITYFVIFAGNCKEFTSSSEKG